MYFTFMGKSTETILDTPLMLCSFDGQDEIMGSDRELLKGETGMYRTVANEYGSKYSDTISFDYALVKEDGSAFTSEEQRLVEGWLTSAKISQYLQLYDCNGFKNALYCGVFASTKWKTFANGWAGISFTFQCNSPYVWQKHNFSFEILSKQEYFEFEVESDDEEEIYPFIHIYSDIGPNDLNIVQITNVSDNERQILFELPDSHHIYIDCKKYLITDGSNVLDFNDIGWKNAEDIYMPKLSVGKNTWVITTGLSATNIDIFYLSSSKIIGGWLHVS